MESWVLVTCGFNVLHCHGVHKNPKFWGALRSPVGKKIIKHWITRKGELTGNSRLSEGSKQAVKPLPSLVHDSGDN